MMDNSKTFNEIHADIYEKLGIIAEVLVNMIDPLRLDYDTITSIYSLQSEIKEEREKMIDYIKRH